MKPHKHCDLIKAWADGAEIQAYDQILSKWVDVGVLIWDENHEYRIKPREFEDGMYYPLISKRGVRCFGKFCTAGFRSAFIVGGEPETEDKFHWIGEPLDITWPEEAE